jgi:3-phenylpropionate/cinnamic acid dioxygenase small subunit
LTLIYTDDVAFAIPTRAIQLTGLRSLTDWYEAGRHPAAHLLTNALIEELDADHARARSKYLTVQPHGMVGTGEYADTLVRTGAGWRIRSRAVTVRAAPGLGGDASSVSPT